MQDPVCYEKYPAGIVIVSNLVQLSIYAAGAMLVSFFGLLWIALYIFFIVLLEIRLLGRHCTDCYYFGKICAFGKGRLSCLIFKKGDPERFSQKKIGWKDMIPDFLVTIIPLLAGIASLVIEFRWTTLFLIIILIILGFPGTAFVRGRLACSYCWQRETGCPALELFGGKK